MTLTLRTDEVGQRLLLGAGVRHELPAVLDDLGIRRAALMTSSSAAAFANGLANGLPKASTVALARGHVPAEIVAAALDLVAAHEADGLVSVGGGSATGLAKAVARRTRLAIVAVPTTLAGSEATPVWGVTEGGHKRTGRDPVVQPRVVLADPETLQSVPSAVLGSSGLNALAHATAAFVGAAPSPLSRLLAADGARRLLATLARAAAADIDALAESVYGAQLTARGFALAGGGAHHRMCHALGGAFGLPHAATHAVLLPHTVAALPHEPKASLADAWQVPDVVAAVTSLTRDLETPRTLAALGLDDADVEQAVDLCVAAAGPDLAAARVRAAVVDAHTGAAPGAGHGQARSR